jgi:hypothetical protein
MTNDIRKTNVEADTRLVIGICSSVIQLAFVLCHLEIAEL